MRITFGRLSAVTAAIVGLGLMGTLAVSARADSIECFVIGNVRLSPGLSEQPQVQTIRVSGFFSRCSKGSWEGHFSAHLTTAEPVSCAALKGAGAPSSTSSRFFIKWVRAFQGNSSGSFSMPLSETSVSLGGMVTGGAFHGNAVSGAMTQKYGGAETCGASSRQKAKKGTLEGPIKLS